MSNVNRNVLIKTESDWNFALVEIMKEVPDWEHQWLISSSPVQYPCVAVFTMMNKYNSDQFYLTARFVYLSEFGDTNHLENHK